MNINTTIYSCVFSTSGLSKTHSIRLKGRVKTTNIIYYPFSANILRT